MWSIYEFEESENSSSVSLHFSFQAATSPFGLSLFSYSQFWDGRIELKDVNIGRKNCKYVSVQSSPGDCWLSFVKWLHILFSWSLGRAEMPVVKAVLGAGWKHLSQKRPYIKLLHTATAKTVTNFHRCFHLPSPSFLSRRKKKKKSQTNEVTNLHWDFSIKLQWI